jgi:hypothetical protein
MPSVAVLPTATATSTISTFPTFLPSPSPSQIPTGTRRPSDTPAPTATDVILADTETPQGTPTEDLTQVAQLTQNVPTNTLAPSSTSAPSLTPSKTRSAFPFTVQGDGPIPIQNYANSAGCNWMGIAGQAYSLEGNPIPELVVHLEGGGIDADALTGTKTAYGAGGYEFFLNNRPVQTTGEYQVQLRLQNGTPLSDLVTVNTFADCTRNLLLVNFVQNH